MTDWVSISVGLLSDHPAVTSVELAGSRSRGTHEDLSDWDFAVETSDFDALAVDLPELVAPLRPLSQQWEPMGHFPVYQCLLRGPVKIEYLFLGHSQRPAPPVAVTAAGLAAINVHFWDWIWWLTTKASIGRDDLVREHLGRLHDHILRPMGITEVPGDIGSAIATYADRRDALEVELGSRVPREAEDEVRRGVGRVLGD